MYKSLIRGPPINDRNPLIKTRGIVINKIKKMRQVTKVTYYKVLFFYYVGSHEIMQTCR